MTQLSSSSLQLKGTLLVALSGMLFGLMGLLGTKLFYLHFSVENMLFWRFLIATLCIGGTILFKKNTFHVESSFSLMRTFIWNTLTYSGASAFYFLASQHIGTGLAMVIFFSFPVFVTLFSWVLGSWKMNKYAFSSLVAVILGLFFLKGHGEHTIDMTGIILAMLAAFFFASYIYGSQHTIKHIHSNLLTFLVCLGNTLMFFILSCYTQTFSIPDSTSAWFYIFAIGIVATVLPIQLLLDGLKYISPVKASVLSALEPVVTVIVGCLLLNETITFMQAIGVMIVLLGAIIIQFERTVVSENALVYKDIA